MRPTPLLLAALILPVTLFLSGCSNRVERIVGNERLIRGPGGLGTTLDQGPAVDRDTYVTPGTANFGTSLLVAMRPWVPNTFRKLQRKPVQKVF